MLSVMSSYNYTASSAATTNSNTVTNHQQAHHNYSYVTSSTIAPTTRGGYKLIKIKGLLPGTTPVLLRELCATCGPIDSVSVKGTAKNIYDIARFHNTYFREAYLRNSFTTNGGIVSGTSDSRWEAVVRLCNYSSSAVGGVSDDTESGILHNVKKYFDVLRLTVNYKLQCELVQYDELNSLCYTGEDITRISVDKQDAVYVDRLSVYFSIIPQTEMTTSSYTSPIIAWSGGGDKNVITDKRFTDRRYFSYKYTDKIGKSEIEIIQWTNMYPTGVAFNNYTRNTLLDRCIYVDYDELLKTGTYIPQLSGGNSSSTALFFDDSKYKKTIAEWQNQFVSVNDRYGADKKQPYRIPRITKPVNVEIEHSPKTSDEHRHYRRNSGGSVDRRHFRHSPRNPNAAQAGLRGRYRNINNYTGSGCVRSSINRYNNQNRNKFYHANDTKSSGRLWKPEVKHSTTQYHDSYNHSYNHNRRRTHHRDGSVTHGGVTMNNNTSQSPKKHEYRQTKVDIDNVTAIEEVQKEKITYNLQKGILQDDKKCPVITVYSSNDSNSDDDGNDENTLGQQSIINMSWSTTSTVPLAEYVSPNSMCITTLSSPSRDVVKKSKKSTKSVSLQYALESISAEDEVVVLCADATAYDHDDHDERTVSSLVDCSNDCSNDDNDNDTSSHTFCTNSNVHSNVLINSQFVVSSQIVEFVQPNSVHSDFSDAPTLDPTLCTSLAKEDGSVGRNDSKTSFCKANPSSSTKLSPPISTASSSPVCDTDDEFDFEIMEFDFTT